MQDVEEYMKNLTAEVFRDTKHFDILLDTTRDAATIARNVIWSRALPERFALRTLILSSMLPYIYALLQSKCLGALTEGMACTRPGHTHTHA